MHVVATLPPFAALRLLDELEAVGIAASSTDMAPGIGVAAYPGLLETTKTVWVLEEGDLEPARRILADIQAEPLADEPVADEEGEPIRPTPEEIGARRRNGILLLLVLWTGPAGLFVLLLLLLVLSAGVG